MNTGLEVMRGNLQSWSWHDIQSIYAIIGGQMLDLLGIKRRLNLPDTIDVRYPDAKNIMIIRVNRDADWLDDQLKVLDREIARRNNLIGVMG